MLSELTSSSSNDDIDVGTKLKIERMESPIQSGIILKREEKMKYKTLLIPNGMRSSYWKYFGFPSADGVTYLTKQKVVCAICSTLLAYNKNTTNLKSHLYAKHRDALKKTEIITQSKKQFEKRIKIDPVNVKTKLDYSSMSPTSSDMTHDPQADLLVDEFEPGEIPEPNKRDNLFIIDDENSCSSNNLADDINEHDVIETEMLDITSSNHSIVDKSNLYKVNLITDMIITDLLPISIISGTGFRKLMLSFLQQPIPKAIEIESQINFLAEKRKGNVQNNILNLTKAKQFSIILNRFKTYTDDEYIVAIVNLINIEAKLQKHDLIGLEVSKVEQKCYVYNILQIHNEDVNYDELFSNLNLNNCISIIINYVNHSSLTEFLFENNLDNSKILIIRNFLSIIKYLIKKILNGKNSTIDPILQQICDTQCDKYNNWYNRWTMLENYSIQNSDSGDELQNLISTLINCLRPLKVTLELLQNDDIIPNASLIKPLIMQLLENHFKPDRQNDHEIIYQIKKMVNMELNARLTECPMLSVLTFLDPRFTHLLTASEIEYVREFLRAKIEENMSPEENKLNMKFETTNIQRKSSSGLDFFVMLKNPKLSKTNKFDHEFDKFMNETATSLEQCPITWWAEYGHFYPSISQVAKVYTNIPACYLEQHKIGSEEYFQFHKKRYLLDECTEKVLYLNLTEEYLSWIE